MRTVLNAFLFPILAGFCMQPVDAAGSETFDMVAFTAPPGWERLPMDGLLSFRSPSSQTGVAQIFLFPSLPSAGTPHTNFQVEWERLVTAPLGPIPLPQMNTEQTPDGWTAVNGAANISRQGASMAVLLLTVTKGDRMMSVVVNMSGQEHLAEVDQFFRQLQFRGPAASTPPAATAGATPKPEAASKARTPVSGESQIPVAPAGFEGNRPVGLFYRMEVSLQGGARYEAKTLIFLPGGRITRTFPYGGGDTFDRSRCLPDTCGAFKLEGGALVVRWDNGREDKWTIAVTPDGFDLDGKSFKPARAVTEAVLVGEWAGAGSSGDASANVYKFERGGAFTFGTGQKPGPAGRYRVQGLTVLLTFADGSSSRRTLFAADKTTPPMLIGVEGEAFKRR